MKSFLKILTVILIIAVVCTLTLGIVLWCTEYKPNEKEMLSYNSKGTRGLYTSREVSIVEWNIAEALASYDMDSYKEGGKMIESNSKNSVYENLLGISETLLSYDADIYIVNDIDMKAKRTMNINEVEYLSKKLNLVPLFAYDKKVKYTPYPWPTEGNTAKGNAMYSHLGLSSLERVALPYKNTSFPLNLIAEKNAALVAKIPLSNSDSSLVLINANLQKTPLVTEESSDSSLDALLKLAYEEYNNGENYVIIAASFNRKLCENSIINKTDIAIPSAFNTDLEDGWELVYDDTTMTQRSLNDVYKNNENGVNSYVTDGYIVSPNISVNEIKTIDEEFFYSAHNPIMIKAILE